MLLPTWMRRALYATGVMNLFAAIGFLPPSVAVRAAAGLPPDEHPLYLATVALFVGLFGCGYLWSAATNRPTGSSSCSRRSARSRSSRW